MDYDIELRFQKLLAKLDEEFGGGLDVQSILFLVGVQELGQGFRVFKKEEKLDLMHIAICTILMPYGHYEFIGRDDDNWPHFELLKQIPQLNQKDQEHLMKEALLDYFAQDQVYAV
ncbi:MAG: hypothetical protein ABI207_02500 [Crocinitomicaceae bacterium]